MHNRTLVPKILTIFGTSFVWFPIFFTVFTSLVGTLSSGIVRFDYLMPAELFPLVLVGALFLLWASLWTRLYRKSMIAGIAAAFVFLVGGQVIAVISGLASGAIAPTGLAWVAVVASIILYSLSVIELGIAAIMLAIRLFRAPKKGE